MKFVKGDILDAKHGIICHQVNCMLVIGSDLSKKIVEKYPVVYTEYQKIGANCPIEQRLGRCHIVEVKKNNLYVANLFAQFSAGAKGITDYGALAVSMLKLNEFHLQRCHPNFPIFVPYYIGCDALGDWKIIKEIITNQLPNAIIVRQEGGK